MTVFLKGFRVDMPKIQKTFSLKPSDLPNDWIGCAVNSVPRSSYQFLEQGYDFNNETNMIFVIEHGFDEQELMKTPVTCSSKRLAGMARKLCTPGIWPSYDSLDDPRTFWRNSESLATRLQAWNKEQTMLGENPTPQRIAR